MNLEQQVPNKQLSQRLKELGVEQKSLFYWTQHYTRKSGEYKKDSKWYLYFSKQGGGPDDISAFTVAELGEMLWTAFEKAGWDLLYKAYGEVFDFKGTQRIGDLGIVNLMRKPDMAAKMLIYLIENKLITI